MILEAYNNYTSINLWYSIIKDVFFLTKKKKNEIKKKNEKKNIVSHYEYDLNSLFYFNIFRI